MMHISEGRVGMKVYFGRSSGEKTLGEITKVNRKKFKVKTLEARGTRRNYEEGSIWTVPPSLCTIAPVEAEGTKRVNPELPSTRKRSAGTPKRRTRTENKKQTAWGATREERATRQAGISAERLESGCDLSNPPTYIKSSRRYLDGTTIRKRGDEYDGQRSKLYKAEDCCRRGDEFSNFDEAQKCLDKILDSAWFNRRFERPEVRLLPGHGRGSYCYFNGDIRLSTKSHMCQRILIHELVHALVPLPHSGHGRLFCAIYLDMVRHFMGEDAYEELLAGYRKFNVKYQPRNKARR